MVNSHSNYQLTVMAGRPPDDHTLNLILDCINYCIELCGPLDYRVPFATRVENLLSINNPHFRALISTLQSNGQHVLTSVHQRFQYNQIYFNVQQYDPITNDHNHWRIYFSINHDTNTITLKNITW